MGKEPEVADADEALGQQMQQEPWQKLIVRQGVACFAGSIEPTASVE